jgi:hypothetical protein
LKNFQIGKKAGNIHERALIIYAVRVKQITFTDTAHATYNEEDYRNLLARVYAVFIKYGPFDKTENAEKPRCRIPLILKICFCSFIYLRKIWRTNTQRGMAMSANEMPDIVRMSYYLTHEGKGGWGKEEEVGGGMGANAPFYLYHN